MNFGQPENHENEVPTQKGWVFRNQDFLYNFLRLKSQKWFSDPKTRSPWSPLMSGFWDGHFDNLFWKKMVTTWSLFQTSKVPWVRGERLLSHVYHRFQLIIGKKFFLDHNVNFMPLQKPVNFQRWSFFDLKHWFSRLGVNIKVEVYN